MRVFISVHIAPLIDDVIVYISEEADTKKETIIPFKIPFSLKLHEEIKIPITIHVTPVDKYISISKSGTNKRKIILIIAPIIPLQNPITIFSYLPPQISIFSVNQTGSEQNRCAMVCQDCDKAIFCYLLLKSSRKYF